VIQALRRNVSAYSALVALVPKIYLVYQSFFWIQFLIQFTSLIVLFYFWRGVYVGQATLGGLNLRQTLNYMLLAQLLGLLLENRVILQFGDWLSAGQLAIELLRPLDFQFQNFVQHQAKLFFFLLQKVPLVIVAWLVFGLQVPTDPMRWVAFAVSLLLGSAILFFFEWIFACLTFYTTDVTGFYTIGNALATILSGALVPLAMMPGWLQAMAYSFPFAQAISVPVSLLSGIIPLTDLPRIWLIQGVWLIGLAGVSRLVFRIAIRQVTFQGG